MDAFLGRLVRVFDIREPAAVDTAADAYGMLDIRLDSIQQRLGECHGLLHIRSGILLKEADQNHRLVLVDLHSPAC
ncbi:hypothetical protein D3C86_1799080 [compost metagenome]